MPFSHFRQVAIFAADSPAARIRSAPDKPPNSPAMYRPRWLAGGLPRTFRAIHTSRGGIASISIATSARLSACAA